MPFVLDYLRAGDVFVDVGANVGVYSLLASAVPDISVIAFEPNTVAYERLLENISINGLNHVYAYKLAIGAGDGHGYLTLDRDTTNRLVQPNERGSAREPVVIRSLDSFLREHAIGSVAVIKIDVEGLETAVIQGALETIRVCRPTMVIEVNDPVEPWTLLKGLGYGFYRYEPSSHSFSPWSAASHEQNVIAIHDKLAAAARVSARPGPQQLASPA